MKGLCIKGLCMKGLWLLALLPAMSWAEKSDFVFMYGDIGYGNIQSSGVNVTDDSGADISGAIDETLWGARFGGQQALRQGVLELGWEGGADIGWTAPDVNYLIRSNGGTVAAVSVKTDLLIFQTSLGLYGALNLGPRVRLNVSGGPAFVYGSQASDPVTQTVIINGNPVDVQVGGKDTDFRVVGYMHAGLHFKLAEDLWLGAGVGRMSGHLNFSDTIGQIPLDEWRYGISFAAPVGL